MKKIITSFTVIIACLVVFVSFAFALNDEYVIKPNDMLQTYVFGNPELNINTTVPPDGFVSFPLVGEINVLGLAGERLTRILEERLSQYIKSPKVSIFITAFNPLKVYVLGAVRTPGAYDYKPGTRLTDYLSEAGGLSAEANSKYCFIFSQNNQEPRLDIDLKKLFDKPESNLDIEINPFDTIYIKPKSGFIFTEWRDIADALSILLGVFTLYFILSR